MDLLKLMGDRYSCRRYSTEDVKEEDILKILEETIYKPDYIFNSVKELKEKIE